MEMHLYYEEQPPRSIDKNHGEFSDEDLVWQKCSLPLGNGHFGASVYGYADVDRIQITENSFANPYHMVKPVHNRTRAGLTSFANLFFRFCHEDITNYTRELSLDDAICRVSYVSGGVEYRREYFTSYPDEILAIKFSANRKGCVSFEAYAEIPYVGDFCEDESDGLARDGESYTDGCDVIAQSVLKYYGVVGYGRMRLTATGGKITSDGTRVKITGADEVVAIFSVGTNYRMESRVFTEPDPKKKIAEYSHPKERIDGVINRAEKLGYEKLLENHKNDYHALFDRCSVDLGYSPEDYSKTTSKLVEEAKERPSKYLEGLLFSYGRYLLISSSRRGCLPANLQGVWSNYRSSPWSSGYWHNINVQMNYWGACLCNLPECFLSYSDYNRAYMAKARTLADEYIAKNYPENLSPAGENGWIIGTGGWPYTIDGASGHSGPGTGAFTSLMFWDYYDYTGDLNYLKNTAYPVLREMSVFFSKTLKEYDGKYLVEHSASPEQFNKDGTYHATVGCAFDQQMVYENYKRTLQAAEILGIDNDPLLDVIKGQIDKLDPVLIGKSGQIKEFREEEYYGDIGEYEHRHVSHLVGLYPGTLINDNTPEYMEGAKVVLKERGLGSSGWSISHRACLEARVKRGENCIILLEKLIRDCIPENLWDQHPPFQIDGNFGYMTSVAEMLLQSQAGYIDLLPALPKKWESGSFKGLKARGNFTVDCVFENSKPQSVKIVSEVGGVLKLKADFSKKCRIELNGRAIVTPSELLSLQTSAGDVLTVRF